MDFQSAFPRFLIFIMFSSILDNFLTVYFCMCYIMCICLSVCAEDTAILFSLSFICNGSKLAPQCFFCNTDVKLQFYILWLINGYIQVLNDEIQQTSRDGLQYTALILVFVVLYALKSRITHVNPNFYSSRKLSLAERYKMLFQTLLCQTRLSWLNELQEIMEYSLICLYISFMIILQYFPWCSHWSPVLYIKSNRTISLPTLLPFAP